MSTPEEAAFVVRRITQIDRANAEVDIIAKALITKLRQWMKDWIEKTAGHRGP